MVVNFVIKDKKQTNINLICILAGGIQKTGEPNDFVQLRLHKAISIFHQISNGYILVLGGGTYHKPPFLDKDNFVIHESSSCAKFLISHNIPKEKIIREWASYDTIANGFFAFSNYINLMNINKLFVLTSDFHMERTVLIFDYFNRLFCKYITIEYIITTNNLKKNYLEIREKREKKSIEKFKETIINKIKTLDEFVHWFYTKHKAYSSIIKYEINEELKDSY